LTESCAHGVEEPTPRKPVEVMVVVPVLPAAKKLERVEFAKREVEVALANVVLPERVSVVAEMPPFALSWPPTLSTEPIVEDAVTESADVVAPVNVALVPVRVAIVAAPNVAPPSALN